MEAWNRRKNLEKDKKSCSFGMFGICKEFVSQKHWKIKWGHTEEGFGYQIMVFEFYT